MSQRTQERATWQIFDCHIAGNGPSFLSYFIQYTDRPLSVSSVVMMRAEGDDQLIVRRDV